MMKYFKMIVMTLMLLLVVNSVYSVTVVKEETASSNKNSKEDVSAFESFMSSLSWALIIGASFFLFIIIILFFVVGAIYEKVKGFVRSEFRKQHDEQFAIYYSNHNICKRNARTDMRKAKWWTLWLWTKRSKIFLENDEGRRYLGKYDGHAFKKEGDGWFMVAIHSFLGIKNTKDEILFLPKEIYEDVIYFDTVSGKNPCLVIKAEGIDEANSSDYFLMPIIKGKQNKFIDFSDKIQDELLTKYTHRKVIREQTEHYKDNMRKAADTNPFVQLERKSGSRLKE